MHRILALIRSGKNDGIGPAAISGNKVNNLSGGSIFLKIPVNSPGADEGRTRDRSELTPFKKIISSSAYALYPCTHGENFN